MRPLPILTLFISTILLQSAYAKGTFAEKYPSYAKLFNNCLSSQSAPQISQLICYPHEASIPRYQANDRASHCEWVFANGLLNNGFKTGKADLGWADAILFSKDAKEPKIFFNMEIPQSKYQTSRKGEVVVVLPKRRWCKDNASVLKDLNRLSKDYEAFQKHKNGQKLREVAEDPLHWAHYLDQRTHCEPSDDRYVAMPIKPVNLVYIGGKSKEVEVASTPAVASVSLEDEKNQTALQADAQKVDQMRSRLDDWLKKERDKEPSDEDVASFVRRYVDYIDSDIAVYLVKGGEIALGLDCVKVRGVCYRIDAFPCFQNKDDSINGQPEACVSYVKKLAEKNGVDFEDLFLAYTHSLQWRKLNCQALHEDMRAEACR